MSYYKNAIIALHPDSLKQRALLCIKLGRTFQESRVLDSAQVYFQKVDSILVHVEAPELQARRYLSKASFAFTNTQTDQAVEYALKALDIAVAHQFLEIEVRSYDALSKIFLNQKDLLKAERYIDLAKIKSKIIGDSYLIALILMDEAQLLLEKKEMESAQDALVEALIIFENQRDLKGILICKSIQSKIYYYNREYERVTAMAGELMTLLSEFEYEGRLKKVS